MNEYIQRMMDWVDRYHTCAINHVPSGLYTDFPDAWFDSSIDLKAVAARYSEFFLRFQDGKLVGHSRYEYSRERSNFGYLDAYIDFQDLLSEYAEADGPALSLEEVL